MFTLGLVTKCLFTLPIEAVSLAPNLMTGEWGIIFLVFRKLLMLPAYSLSLRGSVSVKINPTYEDTCVSRVYIGIRFFYGVVYLKINFVLHQTSMTGKRGIIFLFFRKLVMLLTYSFDLKMNKHLRSQNKHKHAWYGRNSNIVVGDRCMFAVLKIQTYRIRILWLGWG